MDLEKCGKISENRLYDELILRNRKNIEMIDKFRLRAEKKKKNGKSEEHQENNTTISSFADLSGKKMKKNKLPSIKKKIKI